MTAYAVPKEEDPAMPLASAAGPAAAGPQSMPDAGPGGMAATAVPTAEGPGLAWTAPAGWTLGAPAPMRKATYVIPAGGGTVELTITAFPGDVGGELANVNRWRGQVQLAPLAADELAGAVTRRDQNGLPLTIVDFGGSAAKAQRILGAIVPYGGGTWFFKLTGPDALVAGAKPEFLGFLETIRPAQP